MKEGVYRVLSDTVGCVCVDVTVLDVLMILLYVEPTWKHVGSGFVGGVGEGEGESRGEAIEDFPLYSLSTWPRDVRRKNDLIDGMFAVGGEDGRIGEVQGGACPHGESSRIKMKKGGGVVG